MFKRTISSARVPDDHAYHEYRARLCAGIIIQVSIVIETMCCLLLLSFQFTIYETLAFFHSTVWSAERTRRYNPAFHQRAEFLK